jgi:hypothetical protein
MPSLLQGFAKVVDRLGFEILHNQTGTSFISSDNPVIFYDPDIAESDMKPYNLKRSLTRIELFFPINTRMVLHGHSELRSKKRFRHIALTSRDHVKRINRLAARFGYRFIFAGDRTHEPLIQKCSNESPVLKTSTAPTPDGRMFILHEHVFGPRPQKPKWTT